MKQGSETADLVVLGGTIYTMDALKPRAEALAVKDGRFLAVGSAADVSRHIGSKTQVIELKGDDDGPFAALVFKTASEPHVGELTFFRIFSGMVVNGQEVVNATREQTEELPHLSISQGKERIEVNRLHAGDIGVVAKLKDTHTNDTLCFASRPLVLQKINFPQPDIALLRPRADFYTTAHPVAEDVLLLIEVAETSLRLDRRLKIPLYARALIREAWLVDLNRGCVEVHREPAPAGYRDVRALTRDGAVTPLAFPDLTIAIVDLLG